MELEERKHCINTLNNIVIEYEKSTSVDISLLVQTKQFLELLRMKTPLKSYDLLYNDLMVMINGIAYEQIEMAELITKYEDFKISLASFRDDYVLNRNNNFKLSFVYVTARIEMALYHAKMLLEYNGDVDIEVILCHNYNQELNELVEIDIDDVRFKYVKNDHTPYDPNDVRSYTYNVVEGLKSATGDFVFPLSDKDFVINETIDYIHYILQNTYDVCSIKSILCTDDEIFSNTYYELYEKGFDAMSQYFINYSLSGIGYKVSEIDFDLFYNLIEENDETFLTYIQAFLGFEMCLTGNVVYTEMSICFRDYEYINNRNVQVANNGVPVDGYLLRPYTPRGRMEVFRGFLNYFSKCGFSETEFKEIMNTLIPSYFTMINSAYINDTKYTDLDFESLENNLSEFREYVQKLLTKTCTSNEQFCDLMNILNEHYISLLSQLTVLKTNLKIKTICLCKVCNSTIYLDKPMITYENVPDRSQNLLKADELQLETNKTLKVYQCEFCSTVQLNSEPLEHFEEVIRASSVSKVVREQKTKQFQSFIDKYKLDNKKMLEVGCGNGDYLEIVNSLNVDAYGIEYSQNNVDICKEKGLDVTHDYIFAGYHKARPFLFDAFYCINYLEHIPTPNIFLKGIYNNTTDDAVGIIEVPNFEMMAKDGLYSEFVFDHLVYYTMDTLTLVLNKNGFEILESNCIRDDYVLSVVVRKKQKTDFSKINAKKTEVTTQVESFINNNKNVAIWGAGHQSFFVLSQINNYKKVKCIFDNADFKQGKVSPATHIPIIAPDFTKGIDAILVIGGSYSDEIVEIIKSNNNYKGVVAKLTTNGVETCN